MNRAYSQSCRIVSLFLAATVCNLSIGCTFYKLREHPVADLVNPPAHHTKDDQQKGGESPWKGSNRSITVHYKHYDIHLRQIEMGAAGLTGTVSWVAKETGNPDGQIHDPDQALEAHLSIDTLDAPEIIQGAVIQIPFSSMRSVRLYDVNVGATVMTYVGIAAGGCAVIAAIVTIIYLLTKQSCPFIYAYNGSTYHFYGEIYSGAIYRSLERSDYLALPAIAETTGAYSVRITNEVHEIQHTNFMELLVIDHPAGNRVLIDQAGMPHTITNPQTAVRCTASSGADAGPLLGAMDSLTYLTDVLQRSRIMDDLTLTFKKPVQADRAKLVLRAKNSFWLDYMVGQFLDLFGNKLDKWNESRAKGSKEEIRKWMQEQGFPLAISVDDGSGFKPVECLPEAGPMAFRDYVVPLSLGTTMADSIRVKFAFGAMFWEIDYAAIDFSPDAPMTVSPSAASGAKNEKGADVLAFIARDDQSYYDQPNIGNRATVVFPAPAKKEGSDRTVFLHSKGYYTILRPPKKTPPDVAYLQRFKKPGGFIQFSNDRLRTIYEESVK